MRIGIAFLGADLEVCGQDLGVTSIPTNVTAGNNPQHAFFCENLRDVLNENINSMLS